MRRQIFCLVWGSLSINLRGSNASLKSLKFLVPTYPVSAH